MLEDIQVALTELDKVAFYFKQLDESLVASEYFVSLKLSFSCLLYGLIFSMTIKSLQHCCIFSANTQHKTQD